MALTMKDSGACRPPSHGRRSRLARRKNRERQNRNLIAAFSGGANPEEDVQSLLKPGLDALTTAWLVTRLSRSAGSKLAGPCGLALAGF